MKVVIIGGGVTGLFSAIALKHAGADVTLISESIGGLVNGYRLIDYQFDYGGHVYSAKDPRINMIMKRLPSSRFHERRSAFYLDRANVYIPYPVQSHSDVLGLTIDSSNKYSGYRHDNFYDWSVAQFGHNFTHGFMEPFNERVWSTTMAAMDSDWVATRVQIDGEKRGWGPNSSFWYVPGQDLIKWLTDKAIEMEIRIISGHATLTTESMAVKTVFVNYPGTQARKIAFDWLISTMPINTLLSSLKWPLIHGTKQSDVLAVLLALNRKIDGHFDWIYNNVDKMSHRITLLSRYADDNAPYGRDSLLVEIPFNPATASYDFAWKLSNKFENEIYPSGALNDGQISAVINNISPIGKITSKDVKFAYGARFKGYPVPMKSIRSSIATVKRWLLDRSIISCGRWGSHGYFNLEHCIDEADAISRQLSDYRPLDEYLWSTFYYGAYNDPANRGS